MKGKTRVTPVGDDMKGVFLFFTPYCPLLGVFYELILVYLSSYDPWGEEKQSSNSSNEITVRSEPRSYHSLCFKNSLTTNSTNYPLHRTGDHACEIQKAKNKGASVFPTGSKQFKSAPQRKNMVKLENCWLKLSTGQSNGATSMNIMMRISIFLKTPT